MPKLFQCKRCERHFSEDGINPDGDGGLCNACHCDYVPQWAIDLAHKLMELPNEAQLYDWAMAIRDAPKRS